MNKVLIIFFSIILYSLFVGSFLSIYIKINGRKRHKIEILDVDDVSFIEKSIVFFRNIIDFFGYYFYILCLILSRGFFFIFYLLFYILYRITKIRFFYKAKDFVYNISEKPIYFLLLMIIIWSILFYQLYVYKTPDVYYVEDNSESEEVVIDDNLPENNNGTNISNEERNLYRYYSNYSLSDIDFKKLKNTNSDVVSWIIVDNTSVNYPVLKTDNNDFYLSHDINNNLSVGGWIFMDYRNNPSMENYNTIFYGHNLINNTAFGGLANLFTDSWFKKSNHKIIIKTPEHKYIYEVFSIYYSDPEIYYLTTNFYSNDDYLEFLNTIKSRSKYNFDSDLSAKDRIITLSTCSDDNLGRKVVHAKLTKID